MLSQFADYKRRNDILINTIIKRLGKNLKKVNLMSDVGAWRKMFKYKDKQWVGASRLQELVLRNSHSAQAWQIQANTKPSPSILSAASQSWKRKSSQRGARCWLSSWAHDWPFLFPSTHLHSMYSIDFILFFYFIFSFLSRCFAFR